MSNYQNLVHFLASSILFWPSAEETSLNLPTAKKQAYIVLTNVKYPQAKMNPWCPSAKKHYKIIGCFFHIPCHPAYQPRSSKCRQFYHCLQRTISWFWQILNTVSSFIPLPYPHPQSVNVCQGAINFELHLISRGLQNFQLFNFPQVGRFPRLRVLEAGPSTMFFRRQKNVISNSLNLGQR